MTTNNIENNELPKKATRGKPMHVGVLGKLGVKAKKSTKASRTRQLVAKCQQGDQEAFRQLFDESIAGVHRHLSLLIGPGPDTDDLMQLVFLNVFNSIKRFKGQSTFSTWLFRITINVARQEIRMRGRRRRLGSAINQVSQIQMPAAGLTPEQQLLVQQQIYKILEQLSMKKRETFILYTYEGYSLEEIAELLGSSVSTIGSRLQSARKEIFKIMASRRKK